ncbi:hypothetical protein SAMN05216228_10414 [Rhizobium tibeticum]|uniref:Uncharacterized protein n=1 Tax=Rhizobium tibeticum TaxID=501024 RepID=A0A1H8VB57_9HYPH|nr:hypothetical protein RTCCBAU85039_6006 [Rhizobium tibeticum]SEP12669.1 hypothetical protein SAMN05216228_10414 [Rhizobium tibeticum]
MAVEVEEIEREHDRITGGQLAAAPTEGILEPTKVRPALLVENNCLAVQDGRAHAKSFEIITSRNAQKDN